MLFTLALQIRKFSRWLGILLVAPILVAAVGPILAGQARDAATTVLGQALVAPEYRPYVWLVVGLLLLVVLIEILASREEQRNGSKDLRKYLQEIARKNAMLAPDGFFQQSVLGIVGVPLDAVFIPLRAVSDRPRFDLPHEQQEALAAIQRRTDLTGAQQEELIQALRVHWYSQIGRAGLEAPGKVEVGQVLQNITARQPGVVILGSPGSGKSTTLRWLAFHMARAACLPSYRRWLAQLSRLLSRLWRRSWQWGDDLPEELAPCQIPLTFKVGEYAKVRAEHAELLSVQAYLAEFLKSEYEHLPRLAGRLLQELEQGHCLVLIDGLDEVANDQMRRQVAKRITAFCSHYEAESRHHNRFLITSRIVGYEANKFTSYSHYTLQDLDEKQIESFLARWCPVVEQYRRQAAQGSKRLVLEQQEQAAKEGRVHYQRLRDALQQNPGIKNLALNPLMLTLLALLQQSGRTLPHRRIELYQIVTRTLLDNWNQQTERRVFPPDEIALAEEMLSHLAYQMHSSDLLLTEVRVREIASKAMTAFYREEPAEAKIRQFIDTIRESSGLFVEGGQGLFCFMHRTFQEYYVAQYLLAKAGDELCAFIQQHCHNAIWHEPFLLLIAEKSTQKGQEASEVIEVILKTARPADSILQRNVLLATRCVIDCNVWKIEPALQQGIAGQLFALYGDALGAGRYTTLRREIKRLALLWLRGQPAESSSALPPLLAIWCEVLCTPPSALQQVGAIHLLSELASDLPDCPRLVLASLLPPLVSLAGLLALPDFPLPAEIRRQCVALRSQPAPLEITEYALVALRLLDSEGPAGWLHQAWLDWSKEQPGLLQRLSQHALEMDFLLTPAAFPSTQEDSNWEKQLALGERWQKQTRSNPLDLQTRFLQTSNTARFPHSYLYWQMLRQETMESTAGQNWKVGWQAFLKQEMERGLSATYQACFNLRLLLTQQDSQQRQALADEITATLASQDQCQTLATISVNNIDFRDFQDVRDFRYIRGFRDFRDFRYIQTILDIRDVQAILDTLYIRDILDSRYFRYFRDVQDLQAIRDFRDVQDFLNFRNISKILCDRLTRRNTNHTIALLTLYSIIRGNKELLSELQQPIEQALQQFEKLASQPAASVREQRYLIKEIRWQFQPERSRQMASQFGGAKTPEMRARALVALQQQAQLSKGEMEELLDACKDTREISEEVWKDLGSDTWGGARSVGSLAWQQLERPFELSREAWVVLREALEHPDALLCRAATQAIQASKQIPEPVRREIEPVLLSRLDDEDLMNSSLEVLDGFFLSLDDGLFWALQTLAEQDEKEW